MRKIFCFILLSVFAAVSCDIAVLDRAGADSGDSVSLEVNVLESGADTKASDITPMIYETQVNSVSVCAFASDGSLAGHAKVTSGSSAVLSLRTGQSYTVCAVVNGPDVVGCASVSALEAVAAPLGTYNSTTASSGMVMYGKTTVNNLTSDRSVTVPVSRLVSRVRLVGVTFTTPQGLTGCSVEYCYLSNVATSSTLGGSVTLNQSNSSNWYGRSSLTQSAIIDGSTYLASPAGLTYSANTSNVRFYSYPNANTDAVTAFQSSWSATATRLVVAAKWNNVRYYYPVAIPNTAANTSYDVTMTITGPGASDPQGAPPTTSNLTVNVSLNAWTSGNNYSASY